MLVALYCIVSCYFALLMYQQCVLHVEYSAAESVCFAVHWQDLRTTDNWPLSLYAAPSGTTC